MIYLDAEDIITNSRTNVQILVSALISIYSLFFAHCICVQSILDGLKM